ncbi:hypothetical protein Mterra_03040 [Calidithermus terrae]|uniref:Uncharacterized protein n=1 Tax=Calidithermus terrae TaxID=1408545 RepID=A0A399EES3_9DEIN|nr:DUF5693 family protein [Calidithermus terrae]RIH81649.1 hypothetical protein Mterra_03040 [Calidithermus terrae]
MSPQGVLRAVIALAALLSLPALLPRLQAERPGPVVLVVDGPDVNEEARAANIPFEEQLAKYKALGVAGVAIYERGLSGWAEQGVARYYSGADLNLRYPQAGFREGWYYFSGPDWLIAQIRRNWTIRLQTLEFAGTTWYGAPVNVGGFPTGYDPALLERLKAEGYYIVYRPYNHPYRTYAPEAIPPQADALVFAGVDVPGNPKKLGEARAMVAGRPVGWIEGTPQEGFSRLTAASPVLRLFSIRPEWQAKLKPGEVADKFVLAARERGHQILYVRPFQDFEDTREFIGRLQDGLENARVGFGNPAPRDFDLSPLRYAALVGVLAGLGLLAFGYPRPFGPVIALGLLLFALAYVRSDFGALLAALVFPALGFLERRRGMAAWAAAAVYSLVGVVFLVALGSDPQSVLGLTPFKGVSLTLLVPPLLVGLSYLPQDWKGALTRLWGYPIKLGEVAVAFVGLAVLALAVLRRGNDAAGALVPDWELQLRAVLQDAMVRPRFKEIFAHAVAPVALLLPWPAWLRNGLLLLVVVGMGSILNTFSHFHTPLTISLFRVLNGMVIGLILGFALVWVVRRVWQWWSR